MGFGNPSSYTLRNQSCEKRALKRSMFARIFSTASPECLMYMESSHQGSLDQMPSFKANSNMSIGLYRGAGWRLEEETRG